MRLIPDEIIEMPWLDPEAEVAPRAVRLGTIVGVLLADRRAILTAFNARGTIWLGALFTLAAALARDYDAADLLRQPWWLIVPAGASAAVALLIYALARIGVKGGRGFWAGYRGFLGVIWLMSPMAILYGIPWERMVDSGRAAELNLWTLGLVSFWRVVLTARVISVVMGLWPRGAFFRVMMVAGTLALIVLTKIPVPVFQMMGGIRQTGGERVVAFTVELAKGIAVLTFLPGIAGGLISLIWGKGRWASHLGRDSLRVSGGAFVGAVVCMIPFLIALPMAQREQRARSEAESLLAAGEIDAALDFMAARGREEFPPQWIAPPLVGWNRAEKPEVMDVLDRVIEKKISGWVREVYLEKFERRWLAMERHGYEVMREWPRVKQMLARLPAEVMERNREAIESADSRNGIEAVPAATRPTGRGAGR